MRRQIRRFFGGWLGIRVHLTEREMTKHEPQLETELLAQRIHDGMGQPTMGTFVVAIFDKGNRCPGETANMVMLRDWNFESGHVRSAIGWRVFREHRECQNLGHSCYARLCARGAYPRMYCHQLLSRLGFRFLMGVNLSCEATEAAICNAPMLRELRRLTAICEFHMRLGGPTRARRAKLGGSLAGKVSFKLSSIISSEGLASSGKSRSPRGSACAMGGRPAALHERPDIMPPLP